MALCVEREGWICVLWRVRAADGSAFPDGPADHETGTTTRPATWIGPESRGTIWFEDCHIEEHDSRAIYAVAAPSPLEVLGGIYRNNDDSKIRFRGRDCEVDGALIELDTRKCTHRRPRRLSHHARDLQRAEKAFADRRAGSRTTIRVLDHPNPIGGYVAYGTGGGIVIRGVSSRSTVRAVRRSPRTRSASTGATRRRPNLEGSKFAIREFTDGPETGRRFGSRADRGRASNAVVSQAEANGAGSKSMEERSPRRRSISTARR